MNVKSLFTKKRIIWTVVLVLVAGPIVYGLAKGDDNAKNTLTETAKRQNLRRTVLATGQVVSTTDLALSFKSGGVVQKVLVKEGDKATQGQVLATLDQKDQLAALTSARGAYASANANYQKVLAGASSEEVAVAQRAVDAAQVTLENAKNSLTNTQQQQDTAVKNAYSALLNTSITAVAGIGNVGSATVTISGSYNGTGQGVYTISIYDAGTGLKFLVNGLESANGDVKSVPVALGSKGLYIQFSGNVYNPDTWTITIPNTYSSAYVTNYNAYQAALKARDSAVDAAKSAVNSAQSSLDSAKAALDLKKAQARPADIEAARAQILSASGQVQAAESALENTVIRAPAPGTITLVDIKVGEQATGLQQVMVLQDVGNLHVEANVSEANIAELKSEQAVDFTFDALGPDRHFAGKIQTINPASTVVSGVVNYKVTATVDKIPEIKPGMTANMTVLIFEKAGVLAVPNRSVIAKDGKKFIRRVTDTKRKTYEEVEVTTGVEADGGLVEITAGIQENSEVVTFIKK